MKQSGLFLFFTLFGIVSCSHFRGAIFTWAPGSDGTYIIVTFRISWRIGRAFCNDTMIADGTLISGEGTMTCFSGCTGNVGSLKFYCTDYKAEEWSFGRNSVIYVPPSSVKQFSFGFSGGNWIALLQGGGSWSLRATVDLSMRSDNGKINTSPTVEMPPVVNWQTGCSYNLTLPVADVDGDVVKCRWAKETEECGGVCQTFPGSKLDQTTCTISFTASQTIGYYAVALQVEDYANETANTHLSSIPVQFLVNIYSGSGCSVEVEFVSPTPEENEQFIIDAGDTLNVTIFARGTNSFSKIVTILAIGMTQTKEETSKDSTWFYIKTTVTYSPVVSEAGQEHILCFYALDTTGVTNKERCITIYVAGSDNDNCDPDPCFNGATCIDGISNFTCNCQNGYSGETCNSDIDECYDDTNNCDVNAECTNTIGSYTCTCNEGYSVNGTTCSDINECTDGSNNCDANAECTNTDGSFTCSCNDGYSGNGTACSDIDECDDDSHNCNVSAECTNTVGSFTCTCKEGYSGDGTTCLDINECNDGNNNCDANAECTNTIGSFTCSCNAGYSGNGTACSDTDECNDGNYNCDVNAECMNTVGSFMCTCKEGYSGNGTTCSEIIECASSPCQNDANCTDSINGYDCICVHGYSGANCEFDIDDCKPNPCHNDGNCTDGINFYNCTCLSGFYGINCQNVTVVSTLDGKPGATDSSISTIGLIIGVVLAIIILTAGVVVIMKWKGLSLFNRNGHSLQQRPTEESTQAHQNPFYYGNYTYFSEAANMEEPATIRTSKASCDSKEKPSE